MKNARACGHPLHLSVFDGVFVSKAVFVGHLPVTKIADRLNASVWMHGKSGRIVLRILAIKGVKHEDGVICVNCSIAQNTHEAYARAVLSFKATNFVVDFSFHFDTFLSSTIINAKKKGWECLHEVGTSA